MFFFSSVLFSRINLIFLDNQSFLYKFGEKYWGIVDQDGNGSLDFGEFKSAIAALAGSNARVAMKVFSRNFIILKTTKDLSQLIEYNSEKVIISLLWNTYLKIRLNFYKAEKIGQSILLKRHNGPHWLN